MTTSARILVVEDEADVRNLMMLHLKREGYQAVGVDGGEGGLRLLEAERFDLAILDWMLPGMSGLQICKKIAGQIPVLMVTARGDPADVVLGLEMGADDYVIKPFELPVFLARVRALLRRASVRKDLDTAEEIRAGEIVVRVSSHEVSCRGEKVELTVSEFRLLVALLKNQGKVLSRGKLIALVQGDGVNVVGRTVDTHVFGLRKKLGPCAELIETIRGVGYRVRD
jgi:two-component system phosphate regulon response regulator PhoB